MPWFKLIKYAMIFLFTIRHQTFLNNFSIRALEPRHNYRIHATLYFIIMVRFSWLVQAHLNKHIMACLKRTTEQTQWPRKLKTVDMESHGDVQKHISLESTKHLVLHEARRYKTLPLILWTCTHMSFIDSHNLIINGYALKGCCYYNSLENFM